MTLAVEAACTDVIVAAIKGVQGRFLNATYDTSKNEMSHQLKKRR
mgnify:CR=1 FL=1